MYLDVVLAGIGDEKDVGFVGGEVGDGRGGFD